MRSTAPALAAVFALLVAYASLYPFSGWRLPGAERWAGLLWLPLPPWRDPFDLWANFLGYVPLGVLVCLAGLRTGVVAGRAWWLAWVLPALLSYGLELTQHFLPGRYPSLIDLGLNSAGGFVGASLGWFLQRVRMVDRWQALRDRWFNRHSAGALVLLLLWPVGLLFPAPFPFGLGVGWQRLQGGLLGWLLDVPWAQEWLELVSDIPPPVMPLPRLLEGLGVTLGLLAPCLLAFSVTRAGGRRLVVMLVMGVVGALAAALSAALNFGPQHALAWVTPVVAPAVLTALGLALLLAATPQRLAAGLGLVVLTGLLALVAQAPVDPYFAQSLQGWEQGRFIRFHGLAQWVGWLWPLLAAGWLAGRVGFNRVD